MKYTPVPIAWWVESRKCVDKIFTAEKLTEDHKKTLEKYTSLIHLTLNQIGLTSLENFPNLKNTQIVSSLYFYQIFLDWT